jgi:uncharacterized protein
MTDLLDAKLTALRDHLTALGSVVVAFSGGADSAFLAWVARATLGRERSRALTAVSPSLADDEYADCAALAAEWDLAWAPVPTDELANPAYAANDEMRCYHCKATLMDVALAHADGATVVLGVNVDDLGDHRPGQTAASQRGAKFPLVDAALSKAEIRELSRRLGLRTWDKPAAACLASRLPYGTPVTAPTLRAVNVAEQALHRLGFRQVRVRHYGDLARVEIDVDDLRRVVELRDDVVAAVRSGGYRYVTLDLEGFRSGNLNGALSTSRDGKVTMKEGVS